MDSAQGNSANAPVSPVATVPDSPSSNNNVSAPTGGERFQSLLKPLYIVVGVCFLIIAGVFVWLIAFNNGAKFGQAKVVPTLSKVPAKMAQISGNILFQGYATPGAYLVIAEKSEGGSQFKSVITGLVPTTGAIPWTWKNATSGKNYEISAQLKVAGNIIQTSTSSVVSAPGSNVNLVLVSDQDPPAPVTTQISGNVNINGYIPTGANVVVTADTTSGPGGQTTLPAISAVDDTPFSWSGAIVGTSYDLTAQLVNSSGNPIGNTSSVNITAPSSNLQFNINSTAQPPAPVITGLSGNIVINGSIPASSYITIGTRVTGTSSFNQVVSNLSATNNVSWNWQQASGGTSYDIQP